MTIANRHTEKDMTTTTCTAYLSCIQYTPNGDGTTVATLLGAMVEVEAGTCFEAYECLMELHEDGLINFVWHPADDAVTLARHIDEGRTQPCLDIIEGPDCVMHIDDFLA